jgi:hypothetical protein
MNRIHVVGFFFPLAVVIALVILSMNQAGLSVETKTVDSVGLSGSQGRQTHLLQVITVTNDYFLPRRYELPRLTACLYDKDGLNRIQTINLRYTDGEVADGRYPYVNLPAKTIEIPAYSSKKASLFIDTYFYSDISGYDEILLIETGEAYIDCYILDNNRLENSTRIPLLN